MNENMELPFKRRQQFFQTQWLSPFLILIIRLMKTGTSRLGSQGWDGSSSFRILLVVSGPRSLARVSRRGRRRESMKKDENDELRPEYRREDLGPGVRGKYLEAYRAGTNLVLLSPDVAEFFPTEQSVNDALRSLIEVAQRSVGPAKRPRRRRESGTAEV